MNNSEKVYQRYRVIYRNGRSEFRKATSLSHLVSELTEVPALVRKFSNKKDNDLHKG